MPTLLLNTDRNAIDLRDYLDGEWAVLLSHADDFAPPAGTPLGYIKRIRADLDRARVRLLSLKDEPSWIDELDDPVQHVSLTRYCDAEQKILPWTERLLSHCVQANRRPFAMIIDASLCCRATIQYPRASYVTQCLNRVLQLVQALRTDTAEIACCQEGARVVEMSLARPWTPAQNIVTGLRRRLRGRWPEYEA